MHPSFGGFINDPTAQLGFQMGKTAMDAGQQYMEQNVRPMTDSLEWTRLHSCCQGLRVGTKSFTI